MKIMFIGQRKTPVTAEFVSDGIKCHLGLPESCILEAGKTYGKVEFTDELAEKFLKAEPDLFIIMEDGKKYTGKGEKIVIKSAAKSKSKKPVEEKDK